MDRGRSPFALLAAALVVGLRAVYLARFGSDGCPMGYNFLAEARGFALRAPVETHGLPFTPLALWGLRAAGLGSHAALGALYLAGHALVLFASLALYDFFATGAPARRRVLFVLAIAAVPILSADTGYKDLAVLLGAGLMLAALACAFRAAAGGARWPWWCAGAAASALLGAACRFEALAGVALGSIVLLGFGARVDGLRLPRRAALATLAGAALGLGVAAGVSVLLRGRAEISAATYGFYTFYDGLPYLMRTGGTPAPGEFGRYLASTSYFGSFTDHHGSVATALRAHLGYALLRFALKLPDVVAAAVAMRGFTVVGVLLMGVGLRDALRSRAAGAERSRAILLMAFAGPLGVLLVPPASAVYLIAVIFPALLFMARGLDVVLRRASDRTIRHGGVIAVLAATALVAALGRTEHSTSPVFAEAARDLEARCRSGCLVNYLPPALGSQVWADVDGNGTAPLPLKIHRAEEFVRGRFSPAYRRACDFAARIGRARTRGFSGPVLYVDVETGARPAFDDALDPEHRFEGRPDLAGAELTARLTRDGDTVSIYRIR